MRRLTKSQENLKTLAMRVPEKTFETEIVLCEALSGISTVAHWLTKDTSKADGVRVISVYACDAWEAMLNVCHYAETFGRGRVNSFKNAFKALAGEGHRPLCVLLEESHLMTAEDMEVLVTAMETAAKETHIHVRACLLLNRVSKFNCVKQARVNLWPRMPVRLIGEPEVRDAEGRLTKRAIPARCGTTNVILFTREGLEELRKGELPDELYGNAASVAA